MSMNTTTIESLERPAETPRARPKVLYPALVVAAISVTLFSLFGIAALTGAMPVARSTPHASGGVGAPASGQATKSAGQALVARPRATVATCGNCGKVESVTSVERPANTTGVGAVAGGLTGALLGNQIGRGDGRAVMTIAGGAGGAYLGNKIEQNSRRSTAYKIVVRMDNGSLRTVYQTVPPNVVIGGPVQVVGNTVVAGS